MSVSDLLSPLPKPWANINVNSINTAQQSNLIAPVTINANLATNIPSLEIINSNQDVNGNTSIRVASGTGSVIRLTAQNTTNEGQVRTTYNLNLLSSNSGTSVKHSPEGVTALESKIVSAQPVTVIQNLQLPTTGGTPSYLNYYEEASQNFTFSGIWGSPQVRAIKFTRIGRLINLQVDAIIQATTNGSPALISVAETLPVRFRPNSTADSIITSCFIPIYLNGGTITNGSGTLQILNSGVLSVNYQFPSGSGVCGFNNFSVSYSI